MTLRPSAQTASLLDAADLCVKCGLCLPYCPTYAETQHEGDSPRGRITLLQGLASGALAQTQTLEAHLDGCLACRACERVCPAKVPYGRIIDEGRALLAHNDPQRVRMTRAMGAVLSSPFWLRVLALKLWLYRNTGLQRLVRFTRILGNGRLARLESLIPAVKRAPPPLASETAHAAQGFTHEAGHTSQSSTPGTGRPAQPFAPSDARSASYGGVSPIPPTTGLDTASVSLFTGCVGRLLDQPTLDAAEHLFRHMGVTVDRPAAQTCCGAIHEHGGLPQAARRNVMRNLDAFAQSAAVVHSASGCGATLIEYPQIAADDARTREFVTRVEDLPSALLKRWPSNLQLKPLRARAALHLPCTQLNVLGGTDAITALLRKIPDLEIVALDPAHRCCGAAGTYFVTQPQMADQLLERKLQNAAQLHPDYIISTNIGCSLHIAGGLRRRGGAAPEVLHPATLLARQLPD